MNRILTRVTQYTKIRPAAENFVERFGKDAPTEASKRMAELRDAGNAGGWATWKMMYQEVKVLVESDTNETKH